jgi:tellurite resistance protein TehA-like permease
LEGRRDHALGLWSVRLVAVVVLFVRYLRSGPLPYSVGWWGLTFLFEAYAVATILLARTWNILGLQQIGAGLFILLVPVWSVVAGRTLWAFAPRRPFDPR